MLKFKTKRALKIELEELNKDVDVLTSNNLKLRKNNIQLKQKSKENDIQMEEYKKQIAELNAKVEEKELQRRRLAGKIGGLNSGANKIQKKFEDTRKEKEEYKKEIEDLKFKLAESMTDKYRVKKIPSRTPKAEKLKIKSYAKQSQIIKQIMEK